MDDQTRTEVARALGMKPREIVDVQQADGGRVVTTHDGARTLLGDDGTFTALAAGTPVDVAAIPEAERCPTCGGTGRAPADDGTASGGQQQAGTDQVPDGNAKDVLAWVGDDKDRAARALTAERARETPRSTLVADLERLAR